MTNRTKQWIVVFILLSATISLIAGIVVGRAQIASKPVCHTISEDSDILVKCDGDYRNGAWYVK